MSQSSPYEFQDKQEVIDRLSEAKDEIEKWFDERKESLDDIVGHSVGSNGFRAFQHLPRKPSVVFRKWALEECRNPAFIASLDAVQSQLEYDAWLKQFTEKLNQAWLKQMEESMPFGPSRKLPNLLMKEAVLWTRLDDRQRSNLIQWLHVPLDGYTLVGIRNCIDDPQIPKRAKMGFVSSETMYNRIQNVIRAIAHQAGVPSIYFDNLAWNSKH